MNELHLTQAQFLHDEERVSKSVCRSTILSITRSDDSAHLEYTKKEIDNKSPIYIGTAVLEPSRLHMNHLHYNILQPSLKDRQFHYKVTDSFTLFYY